MLCEDKTYADSSNTKLVDYLKGIGQDPDHLDANMAWSGGLRGGATCELKFKQLTTYLASLLCSRGPLDAPTATLSSDANNGIVPEGNGCGGGGGTCIMNASACELAFKGQSQESTQHAIDSCKFAFNNDYHWNRANCKVTTVMCPRELTRVRVFSISRSLCVSTVLNPFPARWRASNVSPALTHTFTFSFCRLQLTGMKPGKGFYDVYNKLGRQLHISTTTTMVSLERSEREPPLIASTLGTNRSIVRTRPSLCSSPRALGRRIALSQPVRGQLRPSRPSTISRRTLRPGLTPSTLEIFWGRL